MSFSYILNYKEWGIESIFGYLYSPNRVIGLIIVE